MVDTTKFLEMATALVDENGLLRLANEQLDKDRTRLIQVIDRELIELQGGRVSAPKKAVPKPKLIAAKAAKFTPVGKTSVCKDGRKFTRTAKVVKARKIQGRYLGNLRQVKTAKDRDRFKKLARSKGVPEALKAILAFLAKKK